MKLIHISGICIVNSILVRIVLCEEDIFVCMNIGMKSGLNEL